MLERRSIGTLVSILLFAIWSASAFMAGFYYGASGVRADVLEEKREAVKEASARTVSTMQRQAELEAEYQKGVQDGKKKGDALLERVLTADYGLQPAGEAVGVSSCDDATAAAIRAERAKAREFQDKLRSAMANLATESARADAVTRDYNLCYATAVEWRSKVNGITAGQAR